MSNGGPWAEGKPSPRHSASGYFSGHCPHGSALRRPDGSVVTAAPQPSEKEKDSCSLALPTATISDNLEHRRLPTVVFRQHAGASARPSVFCVFLFYFSGMF